MIDNIGDDITFEDTIFLEVVMPELSMEQQFEIAKTKEQIREASLEQLQELFVDLYTVNLKKDSFIRTLLAEKLGIDIE